MFLMFVLNVRDHMFSAGTSMKIVIKETSKV